MVGFNYAVLAIACTLFGVTRAGDDEWLSPVYTRFFEFPLPIPSVAVPKATYTNETTGIPIDFYEIKVKPFTASPYPGKITNLVGYDGQFPGPTFKVQRGRETVVRFVNEYNRPSSVHLHGSPTRAPWDGWAENTFLPGQYLDYYYPNNQAGRTLWYHDHAVHITAENAYFGQAGFYILEDAAKDAQLQLPTGKYDIPLMITSVQYKSDYQLLSPAGEDDSLYGDVIQVNGQPWPYLAVEPRRYRFRLLDAAISRTFLLSLRNPAGNAIPFQVIASDAGYLTSPQTTSSLYMAMAERYEIIVDFSGYKGQNITMRNGRDVQADEDYNSTNRVMRFVVGQTVTDTSRNAAPPAQLAEVNFPPARTTVDRTFEFGRTNGEWRINDIGFADASSRILAKPPLGTTEVWELENSSGGWSHPIHIHLIDFKIISRSGERSNVYNYESAGVKDVVLLGRNEKVRVLAQYQPHAGLYMFHCHNAVHEDQDMMAAFNVTTLANFGYPSTERFVDPMEQRWRAKEYSGTNLQQVQSELLPFFSSLDAYASVEEIEQALHDYYNN